MAVPSRAAADRSWHGQYGQVRDSAGSFLNEFSGEDDADPTIQFGLVDPAKRELLTQLRDKPVAVGIMGRHARQLPRHRYPAGLTTTADPYATISVSC